MIGTDCEFVCERPCAKNALLAWRIRASEDQKRVRVEDEEVGASLSLRAYDIED